MLFGTLYNLTYHILNAVVTQADCYALCGQVHQDNTTAVTATIGTQANAADTTN